jgi:hypothetical protein
MSLLELERISVGQVGLKPGSVKMLTTDNLATITAAGYLNGIGNQIVPPLALAPSDLITCLYSYNASTDMGTLAFLQPSISNGVITLNVAANPVSSNLTNGHIFVGNASNVATDVAMTGDVTISNTGVTAISAGVIVNTDINAAAAIAFSKLATLASGNILVGSAGGVATSVVMSGDATIIASGALTIAANAITTAKILNANVTLAKLATGITPSSVVKFAAQYTTVGGATAEAITVTGALSTDIAFVQLVAPGTNTVTVHFAVVTNNTLTVTFSADPGNNAIINYQLLRAAS